MKTQVWIAISTYVLVAILKRELKVDRSLSAISQIISLTLFEKTPVIQALTTEKTPDPDGRNLRTYPRTSKTSALPAESGVLG